MMSLLLDESLPNIDQITPFLLNAASFLDRLTQADSTTIGLITVDWDRVDIQPGSAIAVIFENLRIRGDLIVDDCIAGDLRLAFDEEGEFLASDSYFHRYEPDRTHIVPLTFTRYKADEDSFVIGWTEPNLNYWFQNLVPNVIDENSQTPTDVLLQVLFGPRGGLFIKEIRFEWKGLQQQLGLAGKRVTLPAETLITLLARNDIDMVPQLVLYLTTLQHGVVTSSSTFAWDRDGERELQNDEDRQQENAPLFVQTFTAVPANGATLILLDAPLGSTTLPDSFLQLSAPIVALNLTELETLFAPIDASAEMLDAQHWITSLDTGATSEAFTLPFLKQKQDPSTSNHQSIALMLPPVPADAVHYATGTVAVPSQITLQFGPLTFDLTSDFAFSWQTFALQIDHDAGIKLFGPDQPFSFADEHLGLRWRLTGAAGSTNGSARRHYFTVVTKDFNYQVQLAQGAVLELEFTKASEDPIVFAVSDFALTPKGVSLTARVVDQPVRLNGIETRFRFRDSSFQIQENRIADFTLTGTGPLPSELVGDAIVDIALQFKQVGGNVAQSVGHLELVAGGARLKGSKLLDCKQTRFQFSVDAINLKFVYDGAYHLYFTLSGSAQFVLAAGDNRQGPLALLPKIKIDMVDCPLTGNARIIARHVKFLVELPKPKSFSFFGCFEMELRGIGFLPQAEMFGQDAAMQLAGKVQFAQGPGDTPDSRFDYHLLFIGLPELGGLFPRIFFENLPVNINIGAAFRLNGTVHLVNKSEQQGFAGVGTLEIQGLPTMTATFAFMRVRRDEMSPWLRAWFIYVEASKVSFRIPVVELYIREVGLGFGYRYTLVSFKAADRINDARNLLAELQKLSRTQGDLSKIDRWDIDLEDPGQDVRWTIVLRALIAQTSMAPSPLMYNPDQEAKLACTFLFDAVIAFRSDLTFYMAARLWLNTNYHDYLTDRNQTRSTPLLSGFVLLSPRRKQLLANVSTNPGGRLGDHPPLPDFIKTAIQSAQFTMTLLVEPGLFHYELGWPNMLRWKSKLGPLDAEFQGGFIFRVSKTELVNGTSFLARATLAIRGEVDLGLVGVRVSASARIAFGARYIGVISFADPENESALYGAIGIEANITFAIAFWLKIPLAFTEITIDFDFSLSIGFTAGLEIGIDGLGPTNIGLRGTGTLSVSAMGHSIEVTVTLAANDGAVTRAFARTEKFLQIGLEATEVERVPGVATPRTLSFASDSRATLDTPTSALTLGEDDADEPRALSTPDYNAFVVRPHPAQVAEGDDWVYFVLLPRAEREQPGENGTTKPDTVRETGFLPTPPSNAVLPTIAGDSEAYDFVVSIPAGADVEHYSPEKNSWTASEQHDDSSESTFRWKIGWQDPFIKGKQHELDKDTGKLTGAVLLDQSISLRDYLVHAYLTVPRSDSALNSQSLEMVADADPRDRPDSRSIEDARVHNPSDDAFEAAVRGAFEQFRGSPYFKRDRKSEYEQALAAAFQDTTTVYTNTGMIPDAADRTATARMQSNQQARQLRGVVVHDLISNVRSYAARPDSARPDLATMLAFRLGLVFRVKHTQLPEWLRFASTSDHEINHPTIIQRLGATSIRPDEQQPRQVRVYNVEQTDFAINPPQFRQVQQFTDANTIAITWNLAWDSNRGIGLVGTQADPEHHLLHYEVRRRALDGREREVVTTIKSTHALHREQENGKDVLKRLKPRFHVVDHFNHETQQELATLPAEGRSYLYTITPIDFSSHAGRPLTLVATRYPNWPPQVPTNAELLIGYRLSRADLDPAGATNPRTPQVVEPHRIYAEWSTPIRSGGPYVAVERYVLLFRKEATLPIGSYGLDSTTQGPQYKSLPTSNARPLPTDARIEIPSSALTTVYRPDSNQPLQRAIVDLDRLRTAGILPAAETPWRPESWRIFVQAIGRNGVPSALAPVQLLLRVESEPEVSGADPDAPLSEREERRPAQLEWLPRSIRFSMLPPEDQRVQTGDACFPMPLVAVDTQGQPRATTFDGTLQRVMYQEHPSKIRMLRFRWNQGPSNSPDYPLALNAGFHLLELDVDGHTTAVFTDPDLLAKALRQLQEIQMLPAEDLLLTPNDTFSTSQWEAWYPSSMLRQHYWHQLGGASQTQEIALSRVPWYSWRESLLVWPSWPGLTDTDAPFALAPLHPVLQAILDELDKTFALDMQGRPPLQPGSFADFRRATAAKTDPYGWGILQHLGLSVTFSLRQSLETALNERKIAPQQRDRTGELVAGEELLAVVNRAIRAVLPADVSRLTLRHLHVELLVQPGERTQLASATELAPTQLLAIVQLSLRPIIEQQFQYGKLTIKGPPQTTFDLLINVPVDTPCSLIEQRNLTAGQIEFLIDAKSLPNDAQPGPIVQAITLPLNGETTILIRTSRLLDITLGIGLKVAPDRAALPSDFVVLDDGPPLQLTLHQALDKLSKEQREKLRSALGQADKGIADLKLDATFTLFPASDERATYFTTLDADVFARVLSDPAQRYGVEWQQVKRYFESLNSTDNNAPRISVPTAAETIKDDLPDILGWLQRFFDHGGGISIDAVKQLATTDVGPWLAIAYPRAGSPAYAAPDVSGRLQYDHILEDRWAHTYRFYIRPYGRYDMLWQRFRQSPLLFPNPTQRPVLLPDAVPDPELGGLDVVLDRTQPLDRPLILSSRRLDADATPGAPVSPGSTWEVILAQHHEQSLVERNQTLARQLAFRHVAFTLVRRFAYPDWFAWITQASATNNENNQPAPIVLQFVEQVLPAIPTSYPSRPDHIRGRVIEDGQVVADEELPLFNLQDATLSDEDARSLDIPNRLGSFQQGAMIVQWEGVPFYYEHRLLTVAHTASTVSHVNMTTQHDFEYRSPEASAAVTVVWVGDGESYHRTRELRIPVRRLWDSLPATAQARWASEDPALASANNPGRRPSSLPDLDVVYQLVERFSGNIEVQAELFFDQQRQRYAVRQLGQRLLVVDPIFVAPEPATLQDDYHLVVRVTVVGLSIPEPSSEEPITRLPAPEVVAQVIKNPVLQFVATDMCMLVWEGPISANERTALLALRADEAFMQALQRLVRTATTADVPTVIRETMWAGPDQPPATLAARVHFEQDTAAKRYLQMTWNGPLAEVDIKGLKRWATFPAFTAAVDGLIKKATQAVSVTITPPRPLPSELPESLRQQLQVAETLLRWSDTLPIDAQRADLQSLVGDDSFVTAIHLLLAAIDAGQDPSVPLLPLPERPRQSGLSAILDNRLAITPILITWSSGQATEAERTALTALQQQGDTPFQTALQALIAQIATDSISVDCNIPFRTQQEDLPPILRNKLLVGRAVLRCQGLIAAAEGRDLQAVFDQVADRQAIQRLYVSTLRSGLRNRTMFIRTRRGSANVSAARDFDLTPL